MNPVHPTMPVTPAADAKSDRNERLPRLGVWFGNFFEPFYSDREAVCRGIDDVADLGFTSINLDSKPWEDFFVRYRGGPASPYVAMQETMMQEAAARGLDYTHLALYLCGDNLYPTIRDVPPVRGEESVRPDGSLMGTYKYWSPKAQRTMVEHVLGLLRLYGPGMHRRGDGRIVMQTMFDPIPKPSFDVEGRTRYLAWLERRYCGEIDVVNRRYGIKVRSFEALTPGDYWLRPEKLTWVECAIPTKGDFAARTPDFFRWIDNQTYLAGEMLEYFASMKRRWSEAAPELFVEPVLHQWGYFFNPPGQTYWPTAQRALDVFRIAPHVDGTLFITSPLNAENRPDGMAVSVEASILRGANAGRSFTGGLYLGRHVNGDIYRTVPPSEAISTLVAAGARALHAYGYSGLDDGGVMYRMDDVFKESVRSGLRWATQVIPLLQAPRTKEVALLFPAEMSLYEPLPLDTEGRHRMDLLGWYTQFTDLGWHVDIVHPDQVAAGVLSDYQIVVLPHNSLEDLRLPELQRRMEDELGHFVVSGGTLFHGPNCGLVRRPFGVEEVRVEFDCINWKEPLIPHGWSTVAFAHGDALGTYLESGLTAMALLSRGKGRVVSIGFEYGYAYSRLSMPIVPPKYGRREMHPVVLLTKTPIELLVGHAPLVPFKPVKGLEFARFGARWVVVNHRSSPIDLRAVVSSPSLLLGPGPAGWLPAHAAVSFEA